MEINDMAKTVVIRKSPDYVLEAEIDGSTVSFYKREGSYRWTLSDLTVEDLKKVIAAATDSLHVISEY